eukprot:GHVU01227266.1.p1 GENE.GHVU01227266.1~~GHVU01227266.1.p1  ORF type:complete len:255 (+),score=23.02 GHVU01227266.1:98-766(+)
MRASEFRELREKLEAEDEDCKLYGNRPVDGEDGWHNIDWTFARENLKNCTERVRRKVLEEKVLLDFKDDDNLSGLDRFVVKKSFLLSDFDEEMSVKLNIKDLDAARIWVLKLLRVLTEPPKPFPFFGRKVQFNARTNVSTFMDMDSLKLRFRKAIESISDQVTEYGNPRKGQSWSSVLNQLLIPESLKTLIQAGNTWETLGRNTGETYWGAVSKGWAKAPGM